jgi:transcriptional regulator with GAF, ATPase, and Fis domain
MLSWVADLQADNIGDESLQTNKQLKSRHTAELFCISDFWHKQGNGAERSRRATGAQKPNSNNVREEPLHLPQSIDSAQLDEDIFGSAEALLPALVYVPSAAATDCTVLITGEVGTGTELVARAIHRLSHRSPKAFLRVNCAAIPPERMASELLGRQKGSRSQAMQPRPDHFQLAEGGTIFLECLGNLSAEAQLALLRVLQEIESQSTGCDDSIGSDVRLIATTNRDLRVAATDGTFRSDLFDRLDGIPIKLPPLRERKEDIPMLARYFLTRYAGRAGKKLPSLTKSAMDLLQSYPWPGNLRELQRVMERFVSQVVSGELVPNDKEFLEFALMEMLAELPRWESGVSGDGGIIGKRMRKPAEEIEQEWLPCSSRASASWANKKEANFECLQFSPTTP